MLPLAGLLKRLSKISITEDKLIKGQIRKLKNDGKTGYKDGYFYNVKNEVMFLKLLRFRNEFLTIIEVVNTGGLMGAQILAMFQIVAFS